jgi:hypothetical protein
MAPRASCLKRRLIDKTTPVKRWCPVNQTSTMPGHSLLDNPSLRTGMFALLVIRPTRNLQASKSTSLPSVNANLIGYAHPAQIWYFTKKPNFTSTTSPRMPRHVPVAAIRESPFCQMIARQSCHSASEEGRKRKLGAAHAAYAASIQWRLGTNT